MAEPKRIALVPLGGGEPLTQLPGKKDKKNSKLPKTQRFTLTLDDSTDKSCPEFNFANLLSSTMKKKDVTNGSSVPNPLDPFDDEDEDQLRSIAKKFEEKYGLPTAKKKKSRKYDDYVDLGAGYDETDPFIDNTDAYDEVVPAEVSTAHGGFYINSGALEFKTTEKNSESESESSSSSSDSESDDSDSDMSTAAGNTKKRRIIDSDDDSGDGNQVTPSVTTETNNKKKRARLEEVAEQQPKSKKPTSLPRAEGIELEPTKTATKDGRTTQAKKVVDTSEVVPKPKVGANSTANATSVVEITKGSETNQASASKKESVEPKNAQALTANSEANDSSSSSSDSSDSSSSSSDSDSDDDDGNEDDEAAKEKKAVGENDDASKLPSTLTTATLAAIEEIKKAAISSDKTGKCRFFSPEINRLLLAVELQARQYSCSKRQAIYTYLTGFLPCTKHTLLKRAKNLVLEDVESKLKPAIQKLQSAVEKVMGEQIERHATQCQRLAEANPERYLEYYRYAWDPDLEPAGGTDEDEKKEKPSKPAHPRRRFQWSKEIRSILNQVVYLKMECYHWSKLRKESPSEFLMRFLESDIKILWPKGWMTSKILFKESKDAHAFVTTKGAAKPATTGRKSVGAVVDALIPSSSVLSASSNAVPTQTQIKEQPKSNPKERAPSATPVNLSRAEGIAAVVIQNLVKEQPKSIPKERSSSSAPVSTSRSEASVSRVENNGPANKFDKLKPEINPQPSKLDTAINPRPRSDTAPRQDSKDAKTHQRTTTFSDPISLVKHAEAEPSYSTKTEYPTDLSKNRQNNIRESIIQLCSDVSIVKSENQASRTSKPDPPKPRFEAPAHSNVEATKFNCADSLASNDTKTLHEEVLCLTPIKTDPNASKSDNLGDTSVGSVKSNKLTKTSTAPSSSSLASFVDSGMRWTGRESTHIKPEEHRGPETPQRKTADSYNRSEQAAKESGAPEPEDEESMLQRDLARVLEQIGQITSQVESKDQTPTSQAAQVPVTGELKPKSVIKSTGSAGSSTVITNHPSSKPSAPSLSLRNVSISTGSMSSTSRPSSSLTITPSSTSNSGQLPQSQTGHIKFAHSASKILPGDLLNHMASFAPNWQSYYASDTSPDKRKPDPTSPQHPPASQLHGGPGYAVPRSSPNTMHRNLTSSASHAIPASSSSAFLKNVSHTVESMLQQTPPSQSLPIHDSHLAFLQRKSQKPAVPDNNYYSIHGPSGPSNSS